MHSQARIWGGEISALLLLSWTERAGKKGFEYQNSVKVSPFYFHLGTSNRELFGTFSHGKFSNYSVLFVDGL